MALETERKFLVRGEAWRDLAEAVRFCQGYLLAEGEVAVRVRLEGRHGRLTVKIRQNETSCLEYEQDIPEQEAHLLLSQHCRHHLIVKDRRKIEYQGLIWELDEFFEENAGLVLAEVEVRNPETRIDLPPWVGHEVTGNPLYHNSNLASHPYKQWRKDRSPF